MQYTTMLVSALAAAPLVSGAATARNFCSNTICVYETQPGGGPITKTHHVGTGQNTTVQYPADGAVGSQVRVSPNCDPNNIVYWEFSTRDSIVYYDVNIQGPPTNPFAQTFRVKGSKTECPVITCPPNDTACFNNPNGHQQGQVKACNEHNNIFFDACHS